MPKWHDICLLKKCLKLRHYRGVGGLFGQQDPVSHVGGIEGGSSASYTKPDHPPAAGSHGSLRLALVLVAEHLSTAVGENLQPCP